MAYGYYIQQSKAWINAYIAKLPEVFRYDIGQELLAIQSRVYDMPKLNDGQKYLVFKDLAKRYVDSYFHISESSLSANVVDYTQSKLGGLFDTYTADVTATASDSLGSIQDLGDTALEHIGTTAETVADLTEQSQQTISNVYEQTVEQNKQLLDNAAQHIAAIYDDTTAQVNNIFVNTTQEIETISEANLSYLESYYQYTGAKANETAENALASITNIETLAKQALDTTATDTLEGIREYAEAVKSESEQTYDLFGGLFDSFTTAVLGPLAILANSRSLNLGMPDTESNNGAAKQVQTIFSRMFRQLSAALGGNDSLPDVIDMLTSDGNWLSSLLAAFIYTIANGVLIWSASSVANSARLQEFQQNVMAGQPVSDYTASEAAALLARGFISDDEAHAAGLKQGYLYAKTDTLAAASEQPLSVGEAISATRRGIIDAEALDRYLERLGYNKTDSLALKQLSYALPGINDLISMAVREVFSPEIADRFELFSDLPDEFVVEADKQGLSKEWARRYWGAHWQLPSFGQGAEMFHRKLMPREDLELLVRSLDVSPFWRDKLIGITYNQITRVDIRRIFQLGLIDRHEVKERFEKNGYTSEDAELLTKFYEVYSGPDEEGIALDPLNVTLSQIKDLKKLGTLSFDQAVEQLEAIGYKQDYAVILVQSWEDEVQYKARADIINRYTRKAIREDMNEAEVEALFSELKLTNDELTNVKRVVETERLEYDSIPTKAELFTLANKGIIDYDTWYHMMRRHGYPDEIIGWYRDWKFGGA